MATEPTDINEYRRRKILRERASAYPAFFPEPSSRYPNIIFSNPEEWQIVASGLGVLMRQINHAATETGHTVVICDCERLALGGWYIPLVVMNDEQVISMEAPNLSDRYYAIIDNWNDRQKSLWT